MPIPENDVETPEESSELVFILAIAGRIDAQVRIFGKQFILLAEYLDSNRMAYHAFAILDSLSSSYSMFKYFFDLFISSNDSDLMHDVMLSPAGIVLITAEALFLIGYSLLASLFDKEKEDEYKKFIANSWPYIRDIVKGLKNAYKGWRSAVVGFALLGLMDLKYLIMPVGIVLGVFAVANRLWIRYMVSKRKAMMDNNKTLALEILKLSSLGPHEYQAYIKKIEFQSTKSRALAYLAVSGGGVVDGLYLYVGVLGLAVLPFPVLIAMASMSLFYTVTCVVTRVYEEYDYQVRLEITQAQCKLALMSVKLKLFYSSYLAEKESFLQNSETLKEKNTELLELLKEFEELRSEFTELNNRSYLSAGLLGLRNGLYIYSALTAILFLIGSIMVLAGASFPPVLLITALAIGMGFLIICIAQTLICTYKFRNREKNQEELPYESLINLKEKLTFNLETEVIIEEKVFFDAVHAGLFFEKQGNYFIQEIAELFRAFFSALGKGYKVAGFCGNPLQEEGLDGHYHDTPILIILSIGSSIGFGLIFLIRAVARGFGKKPPGQMSLYDEVMPKTTGLEEEPNELWIEMQEIQRNKLPEQSEQEIPQAELPEQLEQKIQQDDLSEQSKQEIPQVNWPEKSMTDKIPTTPNYFGNPYGLFQPDRRLQEESIGQRDLSLSNYQESTMPSNSLSTIVDDFN